MDKINTCNQLIELIKKTKNMEAVNYDFSKRKYVHTAVPVPDSVKARAIYYLTKFANSEKEDFVITLGISSDYIGVLSLKYNTISLAVCDEFSERVTNYIGVKRFLDGVSTLMALERRANLLDEELYRCR